VGTVDGPPLPLHTAGSFPTLLVERWRLVCAVNDRISLDDATEIVGRAKFGDAWVGPATDEEFKLKKEYRRRLRDGLPISEELEGAAEREARADRQRREVNHWLENRGFDTVRGLKEGLDRGAFDNAFEAEFGTGRNRHKTRISPNTRYATDAALVSEGIAGIENKKYPNYLKAAQALAPRAEGNVAAATDRLRKKIRAALEDQSSKQLQTTPKI